MKYSLNSITFEILRFSAVTTASLALLLCLSFFITDGFSMQVDHNIYNHRQPTGVKIHKSITFDTSPALFTQAVNEIIKHVAETPDTTKLRMKIPKGAAEVEQSSPGTDQRLDSQGDKIMARLIYRKIGDQESIVAVHSVNTSAGGGGVRWYEFRVNDERMVDLYQQGTHAPDGYYRWMASPAIDGIGNIGIGYSFGGTPHFAGQRFTGRRSGDPRGKLTLQEAILVEGEDAQTNTMRWEDYTQTAVDPDDDCTIWYVGDYYKKGAYSYSTRIGSFLMPGCKDR